MKNIIIQIDIAPLSTCNPIEASKCNQIGNNIVYQITEVLKYIEFPGVYFDMKIITE